jgi:hypothetical protein
MRMTTRKVTSAPISMQKSPWQKRTALVSR